ncbi:MAG TPA: helix-turn-helix domain-containing protein [Nocardioidaceae bacterium]|nr:helix-turn-helix domain-containing protein [Nocardioidaceae bacterium]
MTTTKAGTKGVPRADREELILAAATRHFAEHGYAATTLADVAADAGITKPLVYSYFGPKEELFAACVAHASENLRSQREATLEAPRGVESGLAAIRGALTTLEQRPYDWTLVYGIEVPKGTAAATTLREHRRQLIAPAIAEVRGAAKSADLDDDDDIALMTDLWLGMLTTLVRWWHAHPGSTVDEVLARCARVYAATMRMTEEETP